MRALGVLVALVAFVAVTSGCASEPTTEIDLDATTTTGPPITGPPDLPEDDPNALARDQVIELAKEECRKDPTQEFGVVVIADDNGVEVNRYEYPCADLEADDAGGDE